MIDFSNMVGQNYSIVYVDPPWTHYGDPNKDAACGKHYACLSYDEIGSLPMRAIMAKRAALFCWMTCPRLDVEMETAKKWGLHYRGIVSVWVKARKRDGAIIHGQGIRPTFTKPTAELLTGWTTNARGRPFPIFTEKQPQVVVTPRTGMHSEKPAIFRDRIVELCGDLKRIELFATRLIPGWDAWGDAIEPMQIEIAANS